MKKCGFTIVELIVSIALIAMLSTILTVVIIKKMKSVKDTTYNLLIESIEVAAQEYALNNEAILTTYAENDWIKIPISTLIEKNYFEEDLINPKTKKGIPITDYVYVTRNYKGKIESHYNINQKTSPSITLNGKFNMYIKLNSPFEDPGVIAFDSDGTDVTNLITKSGTVDTNQRGSYVVSYKYKTTTITRNVIVGDKKNDGAIWYTLTINPSGGYFNESNEITMYNLKEGRNQDLSTITKEGSGFVRWDYTCTGCSITDGIFTMGTSNVTVVAVWNKYPKLTVNLAGGTTVQTFNTYYNDGNTIELINPIKSGSTFKFWTISGIDAQLNENVLTMGKEDVTLTANWLAYTDMFTYYVNGNPGVSGTDYIINDDTNENWRIKFLKSGTFTPLINMSIDVFIVGGGAGGRFPTGTYTGGYGGGGGKTGTWTSISLNANQGYAIVIGAGGSGGTSAWGGNGGTSSAFGYSKEGGIQASGGSGGGTNGNTTTHAGGGGASNGGNAYGTGQGTITREFSEITGDLYAGGGGGGGSQYSDGYGGAGGAGGGANGGGWNTAGSSAAANTGGGGGGGGAYNKNGGAGGSGIVIIRNSRIVTVGNTTKYTFKAIGPYKVIDGNTDNWKIKFIGNSSFIPLSNMTIDAFLVGGGGGGGSSSGHGAEGGGGGGYTTTQLDVALTANTNYSIVIGGGGGSQSNGGTTTGFGYSANGGLGATGYSGAAGGSGGGGSSGYNESYPYAGYGGSDGSSGGSGAGDSTAGVGGSGQGSTTREFGEITGELYGAGGSGGVHEYGSSSWVRAGGATGGGTGGSPQSNGSSGTANTGGGGGGGAGWCKSGGNGGSGVVIIRAS